MLDYEQRLNIERLVEGRGSTTAFFTFADTVSARNFRGNNECHGWLGIKFQPRPMADSSQIIIHVRMLDVENALQQEALEDRRASISFTARSISITTRIGWWSRCWMV